MEQLIKKDLQKVIVNRFFKEAVNVELKERADRQIALFYMNMIESFRTLCPLVGIYYRGQELKIELDPANSITLSFLDYGALSYELEKDSNIIALLSIVCNQEERFIGYDSKLDEWYFIELTRGGKVAAGYSYFSEGKGQELPRVGLFSYGLSDWLTKILKA